MFMKKLKVDLSPEECMVNLLGQATGNEKSHLSSFDQISTSNTMSKLYVGKISTFSVQFSEKNGMGGVWEAIGQCDFYHSDAGGSDIKMYTTTGGFLDSFVNILFFIFLSLSIYAYWKTGSIFITILVSSITVIIGVSVFQRRYAVSSLFNKLYKKLQASTP